MPITGDRFTGIQRPPEMKPGAWKCPSCGQSNTTLVEDGCPGCLAGTQEEVERAKAKQLTDAVTAEDLAKFVVGSILIAEYTTPENAVGLPDLNERGRLTIARALAHYSEHGAPSASELSRHQIMSWARLLILSE
jgi:hypothetical protein